MTPEKAKNIYWGSAPLPKGAVSLGVLGGGCLIMLASGNKVIGNAGAIRSTPQNSEPIK